MFQNTVIFRNLGKLHFLLFKQVLNNVSIYAISGTFLSQICASGTLEPLFPAQLPAPYFGSFTAKVPELKFQFIVIINFS